MKVIKTMALPGKPEFAVADGRGQVFVNLEDKSETASFSSKSLKMGKTFKLAPCEEPSGLALDRAGHRLIVGCGNKMAVLVNAQTGKVLQTFPAGEHIDGAAFDSVRKVAYVSAGEGLLTVLKKKGSAFEAAQSVTTVKGARTLGVDEKTGHVFLPMAKYDPIKPGERRPSVTPGTFALLVIGQEK